jgi:2-desacetyl-2-hydroxyethyl bacteriochlorophyllide A dehydrogenase
MIVAMPSHPSSTPPFDATQAWACWLAEPGRAELRPEPLRAPGAAEVQVRTLHSAISRGTETLVFRGEVPASEHDRMRAPFQAGDFPAPLKYGYASVGVVEAGAQALIGRSVFCLFPHQSRYVVPADAVLPLPEALPPARAVLAANMETALNALWDAPAPPGGRISVVGGGVVGLLVAWLAARTPGCEVELVDTDPARAGMAAHLGLGFASPEAARGHADLVVHASGQPAGLRTALTLAGFEATVLELSWYGTRAVELPLGQAFHAQRLVLRSSQVGQVAAHMRARWTHRRRLERALALLAGDDRLDALITHHAPFTQLPDVLKELAHDARGVLCHRIDYD